MQQNKENIIVHLSFDFALAIIEFSEILENNRKFVIAKQLLKSGTSIGANIREAQNSESLADFIHKIKIASKEISETQYWLELCKHSISYPNNDELNDHLTDIAKIVTKIITTSKKNLKNHNIKPINNKHISKLSH
jgi:four helix bundle protein